MWRRNDNYEVCVRGELHRLHQKEKQIHTPHIAQIHEARHEKNIILEQPQLFGLVRELQDLVDKRWPHLCRPSLPHTSYPVIPSHPPTSHHKFLVPCHLCPRGLARTPSTSPVLVLCFPRQKGLEPRCGGHPPPSIFTYHNTSIFKYSDCRNWCPATILGVLLWGWCDLWRLHALWLEQFQTMCSFYWKLLLHCQ